MRLPAFLFSYHYFKDTDFDALLGGLFGDRRPCLFADSGAFSARTQGARIELDDYAAWLKRWAHWFTLNANLDVIGDPQKSRENQKRLEDKGCEVLPVFHTAEPWECLEDYLERYRYIALGGMVPFMRYPNKIMPWLIRCFQMAQGRAVYHGFGATSWRVVRDLPWMSVDSSSWTQGFRWGDAPIFDAQYGRWMKLNVNRREDWVRYGRIVRRLGFDPDELGHADRRRMRPVLAGLAVAAYMAAEDWLRKRHGIIRIPSGPSRPEGLITAPGSTATCHIKEGARYYLASRDTRHNREGLAQYLAVCNGNENSNCSVGNIAQGMRLHLAESSARARDLKSALQIQKELLS